MYPDEQVVRARLDLLKSSNMVDLALEEHQKLHGGESPAGEDGLPVHVDRLAFHRITRTSVLRVAFFLTRCRAAQAP